MKIAVLTRSLALYSTQSILMAGRRRGHKMINIDHMNVALITTGRRNRMIYEGKEITGFDAIIPRIGSSATGYGAGVIRHFESRSVPTVLTAPALRRTRNKFTALQYLTQHSIPVPKTMMSTDTDQIYQLLPLFGPPPYIVKLLDSTHGMGVILCESKPVCIQICDELLRRGQAFMIQEFIEESKGVDIRAFVVGKKIVATMKRQAVPGEFRSNLHRGASGSVYHLNIAEKDLALRATHTLGLNVAGVDILQSDRGPLVLEVNASPGLEGIETVTRVDIAAEIIKFVERITKNG